MIRKDKWQMPERGMAYAADIAQAENTYDIPHNLLARVAYQESRFRPDIISGQTESSAGAQGIMQIVPKWHPGVNPLNPPEAIAYAGKYLKKLHMQFGQWDKALAAYNWGPGNLGKAIKTYGDNWLYAAPTETQNYVIQIVEDIPEAIG